MAFTELGIAECYVVSFAHGAHDTFEIRVFDSRRQCYVFQGVGYGSMAAALMAAADAGPGWIGD